jgi:hypothetical protein
VEELFLPAVELQEDNGDRQAEINTAVPLVPEASAYEFQLTIENLSSYKSPGFDQIQAELINSWGKTIRCEIHKLIISM